MYRLPLELICFKQMQLSVVFIILKEKCSEKNQINRVVYIYWARAPCLGFTVKGKVNKTA